MTTSKTSGTEPTAEQLAAPEGLNLLGDANAGSCCGGSCAVPAE